MKRVVFTKVVCGLLLSGLILMLPQHAFAQGGMSSGGNGGDTIRRVFLPLAKECLEWARKSPKVLEKLPKGQSTLDEMQSLLSIEFIKVFDPKGKRSAHLYDNGGSIVQSKIFPRYVLLDKKTWEFYIVNHVDLHKDVFHELLRGLKINDDNYVISGNLLNPYEQLHLAAKVEYDFARLSGSSPVDVLVNGLEQFVFRLKHPIYLKKGSSTVLWKNHGWNAEHDDLKLCTFSVDKTLKSNTLIPAYTPFQILAIRDMGIAIPGIAYQDATGFEAVSMYGKRVIFKFPKEKMTVNDLRKFSSEFIEILKIKNPGF
jgi:hypothetical protein